MGKPQIIVLLVLYPTKSIEIVILHNVHVYFFRHDRFNISKKIFQLQRFILRYLPIYNQLTPIETVKHLHSTKKKSVMLVNEYLSSSVEWVL